jgi:uncharacterized protein YraI
VNTFMSGVDGAGHRGTVARGSMPLASPIHRFVAVLIALTMVIGGIALTVPLASADADAGVQTVAADAGTQPATTANLNLRAAPTLDAEILDVIPSGAAIEVLGASENGFFPVAFEGEQGYSHGDYISGVASSAPAPADQDAAAPESVPVGDVATGTATVVGGRLYIRNGPGLDAAVVTVISDGAVVELRGDAQNNYYPISYDGNTGWVSADFLALEGAAPAAPATEAPATEAPAEVPVTEVPTEAPATEVPTEAPATEAPTEPVVDGSDGYTEDEIIQIIYAAADQYGQPREDMLRVARCESVLDPNAVNPSSNASGLFQFLPSTWATTPYAEQDIFDPVANAEAAAWMWDNGRRGEWTCQ